MKACPARAQAVADAGPDIGTPAQRNLGSCEAAFKGLPIRGPVRLRQPQGLRNFAPTVLAPICGNRRTAVTVFRDGP